MIKKIDHIGIAVKDLAKTMEFYEGILGLKSSGTEIVEGQKVKIAFLPLGESKIELLESTSPEGPIAKFIEKNGEGIQHIAFRVDKLSEVLQDLKAKGVRLIDEVPRKGGGGALIAFIHPRSTFGTLIELCEHE